MASSRNPAASSFIRWFKIATLNGHPAIFGARVCDVCDPQRVRQAGRDRVALKRLEVRMCCGSQSRGPPVERSAGLWPAAGAVGRARSSCPKAA